MSRSTRSTLGLLVVAFAFSAFACGGGSGGGTGGSSGTGTGGASGGGTGGATAESDLQKACRAFCTSEDTHNCHKTSTTTVADCMSYRCSTDSGSSQNHEMPAACATAWTNYYKCLTAQQAAGTPNPDEPTKPGCQEPGTCQKEATALANAGCP